MAASRGVPPQSSTVITQSLQHGLPYHISHQRGSHFLSGANICLNSFTAMASPKSSSLTCCSIARNSSESQLEVRKSVMRNSTSFRDPAWVAWWPWYCEGCMGASELLCGSSRHDTMIKYRWPKCSSGSKQVGCKDLNSMKSLSIRRLEHPLRSLQGFLVASKIYHGPKLSHLFQRRMEFLQRSEMQSSETASLQRYLHDSY